LVELDANYSKKIETMNKSLGGFAQAAAAAPTAEGEEPKV
jgi:hypothetical protein